MKQGRWIEVGRILFVGLLTLLYWQKILPLQGLLFAVADGLAQTNQGTAVFSVRAQIELGASALPLADIFLTLGLEWSGER